MTVGRVSREGSGSFVQFLERQVLALLTIRPRLPFSVLVGLMPNRPVRDLFAALRRLREEGRVAVIPTRGDCDILRLEPNAKGRRIRMSPAAAWRLGC
ncbi:MAG: hypothetical protein AB7G48_06560 [Nitrospiraceae bacterium]